MYNLEDVSSKKYKIIKSKKYKIINVNIFDDDSIGQVGDSYAVGEDPHISLSYNCPYSYRKIIREDECPGEFNGAILFTKAELLNHPDTYIREKAKKYFSK